MPALANLFALHDADPSFLEGLERKLAEGGEFAEVWRPAPGWVVAVAPLPESAPDTDQARGCSLAFVEGRDVISAPFARVAQLADRAPERLETLPGDFGFVRFRKDGGATVVRSCGGLVPFYLWQSGGRAAVATRLGDLVRYLPDEPRLDPLINAVWTSGYALLPDGRTFLAGVSVLQRGGFARVEPGRQIATKSYWSPRPQTLRIPDAERQREHAERLRTILMEQLGRHLHPDGGNLLSLSGGVDSSALAALAAGVLGRPLWTVSVLPEPPHLLQRELSYIKPLLAGLQVQRSWAIRLNAATRVAMLHAGPRVACHVPHHVACALPTLLGEAPVRVVFGGDFADEMCGSGFTWPDWAASARFPAVLREIFRPPTGPRSLLRWTKHRVLGTLRRPALPFPDELPGYVRAELREEYRAWLDRRRAAAAGDRLPRRYLALRTEEDGFLAMHWEAGSALGVRRFFPFFNRDILELASECHPEELVGPGTKKLLRAALRDDVPRHNLERRDKGGWGSYMREARLPWKEALPDLLAAIVRPDWHPRPPPTVTWFEAMGLTQLSVFTASLRARRTGEALRVGSQSRTLKNAVRIEPLDTEEKAT